ncbi:hypothetical protein H0E84_10515 [Luteimonas sp. SJ-92]|uniref:Uncharacterized protein n=1 Tax=Luteimonas salinisoli TaxID=2752307 RepID=A0A853JE00_9GAMM|nr:hypothetical protein [Luteimonas salinisoli]NZA26817.1 hypothetical protein [Luteimonas salinisoli]
MRRVLPYFAFAATYLVASLLLGGLLDLMGAPVEAIWLIPWVAAFPAVALGQRLGEMRIGGLFLATLAAVLLAHAAIAAITHSVAVAAGGSVDFLDLYRVGGLRFAASTAMDIAAPLVWHLVLLLRSR